MKQEDLDKLIELSRESFKCPYTMCCQYGDYNQCFNHSYVLCPTFEEYYTKTKKINYENA